MVDKYEAKNRVSKIIGDEYIIPTIGIYDNFDEIDFDKLPNKFVMKCTHDSGGILICKDKKKLNVPKWFLEGTLKNLWTMMVKTLMIIRYLFLMVMLNIFKLIMIDSQIIIETFMILIGNMSLLPLCIQLIQNILLICTQQLFLLKME